MSAQNNPEFGAQQGQSPGGLCTTPGCSRRPVSRGLCNRHYLYATRHRLILPLPKVPLPVRFWSKVDKGDGSACWLWTAGLTAHGYGSFRVNHVVRPAHVVAYQWLVGPIRFGHELHHRCGNRRCCRPDHLECLSPEDHGHRHNPGSPVPPKRCPSCGALLVKRENPFGQPERPAQMLRRRFCNRKCASNYRLGKPQPRPPTKAPSFPSTEVPEGEEAEGG